MENIVKLAKEDKDAFANLYQQHVEIVYRFFLVRCGNKEESEELTSDTWEIVVKKLHSLRSNEIAAFRCWLFQIAKNLLKNKWRKNEIKTVSFEDFLQNRGEVSYDEEFSFDDMGALWVEVEKLSPKQKEVVKLRFASDLKNKEIAELTGQSEKTVASNLSRALDALRQNLHEMQ